MNVKFYVKPKLKTYKFDELESNVKTKLVNITHPNQYISELKGCLYDIDEDGIVYIYSLTPLS